MPTDLFDLTDKVAIVSGAAQGMGRAIALALANAGAHLILVDRNEAGAHRTAAAACCTPASSGSSPSTAGGPGSSSQPGSRTQELHPVAGADRTRGPWGNLHHAAVPS